MAEPNFGMEKAEMKKLLSVSKKQPVNCGLGLTKDGVVLLMDKIKPAKGLVKDLEKKFPDMKAPNWGTAFVDTDEDPTLVILTLAKTTPGVARKMKKTLKGTGFSKVEVRGEDGAVAEAAGDDEEEEEGATTAAAAPDDATDTAAPADTTGSADGDTATAANTAPTAPDTPPEGPGEPAPEAPSGPDAATLTRQYAALVPQIAKADPAQAGYLKQLAVAAGTALKQGDLVLAQTAIANFQQALDRAGPAPANGQAAAPNVAALTKAKLAWKATRTKIEGDLDKLHSEMAAVYKDHGFGADLDKYFSSKVQPVLDSLDDSLGDKLDAVLQNTDPAQQAKLVGEAQKILQKYQSYVTGEPLIAKLDDNPFVPLQIGKTISTTLGALSRVIA